MSSPTPPPEKVLLLAFGGMNTLDWAGPLEVLFMAKTSSGSQAFEVTTATVSSSPTTASPIQTAERGIITPHTHIVSPSPDLPQILEAYSTLVVPGGLVSTVLSLARDTSTIVELIRAFAALPPKDARGRDRIILTICTGSLFLPAAGILRRRSNTVKPEIPIVTHRLAGDALRALVGKPEFTEKGCCAEVLNGKRFVDAGKLLGTGDGGEGVRLITSGGVAAGMDATLYFVERRVGKECAERSAQGIELEWRRDEGVVASD